MNTYAPPDLVIKLAVEAANKGPCAKSKRGVVVYTLKSEGRIDIHAKEFNSPPWPFECSNTDACKTDCGRICVHAEQRAIIYSAGPGPRVLERLTIDHDAHPSELDLLQLVHVKTVDGVLVPSPKGPSCDQCSKLMLEAGISTVWLYVIEGAWARWDGASFHQATLRNCGLHVHL